MSLIIGGGWSIGGGWRSVPAIPIEYLVVAGGGGTTGSPTITVSGGYRIYQFTVSGTITF